MFFKDIIGQDDIKRRLILSVKENRISHAQLFHGIEGTGKLSMALAYAQFISCTDKREDDSCGVCPSCLKYNKIAHPDLHFIYPIAATKNISKPISKNFIAEWRNLVIRNNGYITLQEWYDEIQLENKQGIINANDCNEVVKALALKPYESDYKVMIIYMVEKLFHSAAPKLLKILEEPPDKTLFLLIADNTDDILATILSRTQKIKFPAIEKAIMKKYLQENFSVSERDCNKIIQLSNGNIKMALQLVEKNDVEKYNFDMFSHWMRACYKAEILIIVEWVEAVSVIGREKQKEFLSYALRMIRESIVNNAGAKEISALDERELDFINKFSPFIHPKNYIQMTNELNSSVNYVERNANPKILFLDLSLTFAKLLKISPRS